MFVRLSAIGKTKSYKNKKTYSFEIEQQVASMALLFVKELHHDGMEIVTRGSSLRHWIDRSGVSVGAGH